MTDDPGFLFMMGVYGTRPNRETVALMRETGAASVLLLARNIESPAQVRAYASELVQRLGRPVLFAIDHEGGWVLRFKSGVTAFPGNAALGAAGDEGLARAVGREMGRELGSLGIGLNLAPVLDVVCAYNPGIGIRSFGSDPRLAGRLGAAMIRGLQAEGVHACAKHFPGKGAARKDAHVSLPAITLGRRELERTHLAPFRAAFRAGVSCVMTSHVLMPAFDRVPATFSRKITTGLLRGGLGFDGVVISDDLCMGAVTERMPVQRAALEALRAGHDLIIVAHDQAAQRESVDLARASLADGALDAREAAAGAARVRALLRAKPGRGRPDPERARLLGERIAEKAVVVARRGETALPVRERGEGLLVLMPDLREVAERFTFEGGTAGPEKAVRGLCRGLGARIMRVPVSSKPKPGLAAAVGRARSVVFLCFEAMRFAGQKAALSLLNRKAPGKTCACLIRSPWDADLLSRRATVVDAKGYRNSQLKAAFKLMFHCALLALAVLAAPPAGRAAEPKAAPAAKAKAPRPAKAKAAAAVQDGAPPAAGGEAAPAAPRRSEAPVSVARLHQAFIESTEDSRRSEILAQIAESAPTTTRDIQSLFDLFIRFPSQQVRASAMKSLYKLPRASSHLEPVFLSYLEEDDPEEVVFGINGALVLRCTPCVKKLEEIAKRPLTSENPADAAILAERNAWWAVYEALSALAQLQGAQSLDLLQRRVKDSPRIAQIMATHLWKESLPLFVEWSRGSARSRERAKAGLSADVPPAALRETREAMLAIMRDRKSPQDLRHLVSLKIGLSSTAEEAAALAKEYEVAADTDTRLAFAAALFASRSPAAVPVLKSYVRENANPVARAGALVQLEGMLPAEEYRALLEWVSKNDPHPDNRQDALDRLQGRAATPAFRIKAAPGSP